MSAPTELDAMALRRGLLATRAPESARRTALRLITDERRSPDPVARLSREQDEMCRNAVDPHEIAAGLEAAGISDRTVRETYGFANVFDLSAVLFDTVPRRLSPTPPPANPWTHPFRRHVGRGLLYALPTFPYLAALQLLGDRRGSVLLLLGGSVLTLAATHGLSHLGHLLIGYGVPGSAAVLMRRALRGTLAAGVLGVGLLLVLGLPAGPVVLAGAQLVYVVAATGVMVFERERLLLVSLLPGVAVSAVAWSGDLTGSRLAIVAGGLAACIGLAVAVAEHVSRTAERAGPPGVVRLVRPEVLRAVAHGTYGALVAVLLMYAVLDSLLAPHARPSHALLGLAMLPLVVTLGVSEWQLHLFRSDSQLVALRTYDFPTFARQVRLSLVRRVAAYALTLLVTTLLVTLPLLAGGAADAVLTWRLAAYAVLGVALFVGSILLSCGLLGWTLGATAVAAAGQGVLLLVLHNETVALTVAQAGLFVALLLVLWGTAWRELSSPLRFR